MKVMNKILLKCLIRMSRKSKNIKGNHKPYYNNNLRKAIMKIPRLKKKAKRLKDLVDIPDYKKQHKLLVLLNRQAKSKCFKEVSNTENARPFWETSESYFSNKQTHQDSKIMLFTEK